MSEQNNANMLRQLEITDLLQQNLESSLNESTTQTLFNFYASDNNNLTTFEITQLLLDILFIAKVRPMIVSDEILSTVAREFCWKSCTGHDCTISWKEFKSFFESEKQPLIKLLNIIKGSYTADSTNIFTAKHITFSLVKSNKSTIFNFDFDDDDRSRLKSAISKLAPTVSPDKIFTYIGDENKVSALIIGAVDMENNGKQITMNDIVYSIEINPFVAAFPQTEISDFYASEIMTVYIDGINGTLTSVNCYSFLKIHRFMRIIYAKLGISNKNKLLLIHNHLVINVTVDRDKSLEYYNVKHNSCLLAYVADGKYSGHSNNFAEFGGVNPHIDQELAYVMKLSLEEYEAKKLMDAQKNIRDKCCSLKLVDTFEFVEDLDILTYEMNKNCIKMNCGHGITKDTLYQYSMIQLQNYETLIKCPHIVDDTSNKLCNDIWYYPEIRNVLFPNINDECSECKEQFLLKDIIKLDKLCAMNTVRDDYKTKECLKCHSLLYKNKYSTAGFCPVCDNRFCWKCDGQCDINCASNLENEVMDILKDCAVKTIGSVKNVPNIRCCPRCLQLIYHTTACKHVTCTSCKCSFCFVCMKPKKNGQWQCGRYSDVCPIAPNEVPNPINAPPDILQQNNMPPPNPMMNNMNGMNMMNMMGFNMNNMNNMNMMNMGPPPNMNNMNNMNNMGPNPMMNMGPPPPNPMMNNMNNMNNMGPPPNMNNMGGMPPDMGPPPNFIPNFGVMPPNMNMMGGMPPPNFMMGGMPPPMMMGGMGPNFGNPNFGAPPSPPPPNNMGMPPPPNNMGMPPPPNNMRMPLPPNNREMANPLI